MSGIIQQLDMYWLISKLNKPNKRTMAVFFLLGSPDSSQSLFYFNIARSFYFIIMLGTVPSQTKFIFVR